MPLALTSCSECLNASSYLSACDRWPSPTRLLAPRNKRCWNILKPAMNGRTATIPWSANGTGSTCQRNAAITRSCCVQYYLWQTASCQAIPYRSTVTAVTTNCGPPPATICCDRQPPPCLCSRNLFNCSACCLSTQQKRGACQACTAPMVPCPTAHCALGQLRWSRHGGKHAAVR